MSTCQSPYRIFFLGLVQLIPFFWRNPLNHVFVKLTYFRWQYGASGGGKSSGNVWGFFRGLLQLASRFRVHIPHIVSDICRVVNPGNYWLSLMPQRANKVYICLGRAKVVAHETTCIRNDVSVTARPISMVVYWHSVNLGRQISILQCIFESSSQHTVFIFVHLAPIIGHNISIASSPITEVVQVLWAESSQ